MSDTERGLLCGDKSGEMPFARAWGKVPASQARLFFDAFLQTRGFYQAEYRKDRDGTLRVKLGEPTIVSAWEVIGAPPELEEERKGGVLGERLTPELLSQLELWVARRLETIGYPCHRLSSTADASTGRIEVRVAPGERQFFVPVAEEPMEGLAPGITRRYDAFVTGDPFNGDMLRLTTQRIVSEGTLLSANFAARCEGGRFGLRQSSVPGLPHLLSFGVGANSEGLLLTRASWRNTRLGDAASIIDVSAFASTKLQRITSTLIWYPSREPSRFYLRPELELRHQNEAPFELLSTRLRVAPALSHDSTRLGFSVLAGPSWEAVKTLRGTGPSNSHFLSLELELSAMSHYFELNRSSPRSGFSTQLTAAFSARQLLSDLSAQRVSWNGEYLWNVEERDPPFWVLGVRWGAATTLTPESLFSQVLPTNFRRYLGGSRDLRGFGRNEIWNGGTGGLTSAFAGVESRFAAWLPFGLQPFVFVDVGALGVEALGLSRPLYWSPGVGVRWQSPFGSLRGTLAHGYLAGTEGGGTAGADLDALSHWQFYFSFGEEF